MPSLNKPIIEQMLTNVSSALVPEGHICELVLPFIPVTQYTGKLAKYGLSSFLSVSRSIKVGRGKYREVEPIVRSQSSFSIEGHGLSGQVTKEDYANSQKPYDAEKDETMGLSMLLLTEKEKLLADTLLSTSVLTNFDTLSGASQYSDYNNSTPVEDFADYRASIRAACGFPPNVAIMDWAVWNKLRFHPQLLDALGFKFARPNGLTDNELAQAMGVERIHIAKAVYNSAKEGQTAVIAPIWGKDIVFAVLPQSAQPYQTSLGYRLGIQGGSPRKVYKQPMFNPPGSTEILVEDEYQFLISNAAAGFLIEDAIA